MNVTIEGTPKEIADLVLEIQCRQEQEKDISLFADRIETLLKENPDLFK